MLGLTCRMRHGQDYFILEFLEGQTNVNVRIHEIQSIELTRLIRTISLRGISDSTRVPYVTKMHLLLAAGLKNVALDIENCR